MLPKPTNTILPANFTCTSFLLIILFPFWLVLSCRLDARMAALRGGGRQPTWRRLNCSSFCKFCWESSARPGHGKFANRPLLLSTRSVRGCRDTYEIPSGYCRAHWRGFDFVPVGSN